MTYDFGVHAAIVAAHRAAELCAVCSLIEEYWAHCDLRDNPDAKSLLAELSASSDRGVRVAVASAAIDVTWTDEEVVRFATHAFSSDHPDAHEIAAYLCGQLATLPPVLKRLIGGRSSLPGADYHWLLDPSPTQTSGGIP